MEFVILRSLPFLFYISRSNSNLEKCDSRDNNRPFSNVRESCTYKIYFNFIDKNLYVVFFPNVSSDFQPTEDVDEGHEEKDGSNTAVGGI